MHAFFQVVVEGRQRPETIPLVVGLRLFRVDTLALPPWYEGMTGKIET